MGFLDNISKTISQGVDRAKFEADKFQKTTRLQNEINELKRQIDANRMEFADRAIQLFRAGQFQSATLGEILKAMDAIQGSMKIGTWPVGLTVTARLPVPSARPSLMASVTDFSSPPSPESVNTTTPSGW